MSTKNLPRTAFQFLAPAGISSPDDIASGERVLTGIAYSGELVTDHGYWNRLLIDLSSLTVDTPIPLLVNHDPDETVGMVTVATTQAGNLGIEARLFADVDDDAAEIAAKADKGFPWQLSVGIWPSRIEEVPVGHEISLNGRLFQGPVTVFRSGRVREVSIVALGADHQTSATVLNVGDSFDIPLITHEDNSVELKQLQERMTALEAENNQLKTDLAAEQTAKAQAEQALQASQAQARLSAIDELAVQLNKTFSEDDITQFKALSDDAFNFMAAQLSAAKPQAPEHLFHEQATVGQVPDIENLHTLSAQLQQQFSAGKPSRG